MENTQNTSAVCKCSHHHAIPVLIILFGIVFLLGALNVLAGNVVNIIWPILVIIAGGTKVAKSYCKCC